MYNHVMGLSNQVFPQCLLIFPLIRTCPMDDVLSNFEYIFTLHHTARHLVTFAFWTNFVLRHTARHLVQVSWAHRSLKANAAADVLN